MRITQGFNEVDRQRVAHLYWDAFGEKLGRVMGPDTKGIAFIERVARPDHAICAYDGDDLLGVAGFKTADGAFVDGGIADMAAIYGWIGCLWRIALLAALERDVDNKRFLMDGIFVSAEARGRGVGSTLLDALGAEALRRGYNEMRLDVIDKNTRARALYERKGFRAVHTSGTGPLRHVFRFKQATMMVRNLS
ncbi:GNAT family N-acetyltransferase [Aestuariibius sp. HNIBRBA575]|uniref:GNAT family N-acetyltransferase n=1 Tax=Aestuariibius sp. HNIBRBA575 TaxID=3233343 RepID=UPI0034A205B7